MITGQKVICVDANFDPEVAKYYIALPKKDGVYVIRNVVIGVSPEGEEGQVCLLLLGLKNPRSNVHPFPERGFNAERFRPIEEETVEFIEEICTPEPDNLMRVTVVE